MSEKVLNLHHLHTYFLFPFSIDKQTVLENYGAVWSRQEHWIDGLDKWIGAQYSTKMSPVVQHLGPWRRSPYTRFDMESPAYQDMTFFHSFVRRVFFDTGDSGSRGAKEALLRCYTIPVGGEKKLWFHASDAKGRCATVEVTDLRLFLFANGIGILSIGVEAFNIPVSEGLWINEALRKVYPSSRRQLREGRGPNYMALLVGKDGERQTIAEERFSKREMIGFIPPLAKTLASLIYFADYEQQEFEPMLDERMIVYSYAVVDPDSVLPDFVQSEQYQVLLSRFLYVDLDGASYRYDPQFTRERMNQQIYRRWAHQGTYYGFTSYSNITITIGVRDCDEHVLREGFLVHRMFNTRYYLMALIALFYRATLLDFEERTALVSKRLYFDQEDDKLTPSNIRLANQLRAEFLHFANYWYFDELANKDEELEHFSMQCREFRIEPIKEEVEQQLQMLNASLQDYSSFRNTEAVNRLTMLSLMVGAGAVLTGFFGMNFGREFGRLFFEPEAGAPTFLHYAAVATVLSFAIGSLAFGIYLVSANWSDYRDVLAPRRRRTQRAMAEASLKRGPTWLSNGGEEYEEFES
jgi:hypothetical protein